MDDKITIDNDNLDTPRIPIRQVSPMEQTQMAAGGVSPINKGANAAGERIKKKRGRKPKDQVAAESLAASQALAAQISKILTPENCKAVVKMPGDAMLAMTGDELWNVTDEEASNMAGPLAVALEHMAIQDPKWLAITMALFTIGTAYGSRTIAYIKKRDKVKGSNSEK